MQIINLLVPVESSFTLFFHITRNVSVTSNSRHICKYVIYVDDIEQFRKYVDYRKPITVRLIYENNTVYIEARGLLKGREDTLIIVRLIHDI